MARYYAHKHEGTISKPCDAKTKYQNEKKSDGKRSNLPASTNAAECRSTSAAAHKNRRSNSHKMKKEPTIYDPWISFSSIKKVASTRFGQKSSKTKERTAVTGGRHRKENPNTTTDKVVVEGDMLNQDMNNKCLKMTKSKKNSVPSIVFVADLLSTDTTKTPFFTDDKNSLFPDKIQENRAISTYTTERSDCKTIQNQIDEQDQSMRFAFAQPKSASARFGEQTSASDENDTKTKKSTYRSDFRRAKSEPKIKMRFSTAGELHSNSQKMKAQDCSASTASKKYVVGSKKKGNLTGEYPEMPSQSLSTFEQLMEFFDYPEEIISFENGRNAANRGNDTSGGSEYQKRQSISLPSFC
mmetsp:Transcript_31947/g.47021  ORF Transcript_31947/g.47021 Transcript_31947/m.47021 type:complete len:355 (-) Transcript_31947:447-1511(-)